MPVKRVSAEPSENRNILTNDVNKKMISDLQIFECKCEVKTSSESATLIKESSMRELCILCMKTLLGMWDLKNPSSNKEVLQYWKGLKITGRTYLFGRPRVELCVDSQRLWGKKMKLDSWAETPLANQVTWWCECKNVARWICFLSFPPLFFFGMCLES